MKTIGKKLLSSFLAVVMMVSVLPVTVFADDSSVFDKILVDGKLVLPYARPIVNSDNMSFVIEYFYGEYYPDFSLRGLSDDLTTAEIISAEGTDAEERLTVDVVWDYDESVLQTAQPIIEKLTEKTPEFTISDMELVKYWVNRASEARIGEMINYSEELMSILGDSGFTYMLDVRAGSGSPFYNYGMGTARLLYENSVYLMSVRASVGANNIIYVPESTADTKEALIAAAQKRVDKAVGENIARISLADGTLTDFYNSMLEISDEQAVADRLAEGGDFHFVTRSCGDFYFTFENLRTGATENFIIVKDDSKVTEPVYYYGDINKDSAVNAKDANLLKRVIAGSYYVENGSYEFTAADLDRDGALTAKDSNLLIQTIIGDLALEPMEPENPEESERTEPVAPDCTVYDEMGNEIRLSDYIGKPVVINFWASWCSPCKREMPDFYEKYLELGDEVQFLMVNVTGRGNDTVEDAKAYIEGAGYTFPVFYDMELDAMYAFGVDAFPYTFFIDAEGYIMAYKRGTISAEALQEGIDLIR